MKSLFKSGSLINENVGVNPNLLPNKLISVSDKTLLLRWNTTSEQKCLFAASKKIIWCSTNGYLSAANNSYVAWSIN